MACTNTTYTQISPLLQIDAFFLGIIFSQLVAKYQLKKIIKYIEMSFFSRLQHACDVGVHRQYSTQVVVA